MNKKTYLAIVLAASLIIVSDLQVFFYPPTYGELRLFYVLSPIGYYAGWVIFHFAKNPGRHKIRLKRNRTIPNEL